MAKLTRILSIDGGGIRGIIPARVLVSLEEKLRARDGDAVRLADYFDLVAGTSAGGILACLYLCRAARGSDRPRFSAAQALGMFRDRGETIFELPLLHRVRSFGGWIDERYPAAGLERTLGEFFDAIELSDLLRPCLITAYDICQRKAVFFEQHRAAAEASRNFLVRDVARATSAAPTYFEVACVQSRTGELFPLVDGGVFANNPALCAYAAVRKTRFAAAAGLPKSPTARDMVILSLGAGSAEKPYAPEKARNWGRMGWAKPLFDIIVSGVSETVEYQLEAIFDAVDRPGQYLRIQPDLSGYGREVTELDDASPGNAALLARIGAETARRFDRELDELVALLREPEA